MNFNDHPLKTGNLLKVGLDSAIWSKETQEQYQSLPPGTAKPQVVIDGAVQTLTASGNSSFKKPLIRRLSLPTC